MELAWWALLGALFAAYFALGGLDYGVGLLLPVLAGDDRRRAALNAIGPRFLGNEVWVVAAVGVLFGAFPLLEGGLLSGAQPLVLVLVLALVGVNVGVQLRSRCRARGRRVFDLVITAASVLLAVGWGALLGALLTGLPLDRAGHVDGYAYLLRPSSILCGLSMVALFALHGATYLSTTMPAAAERERMRAIAARLSWVAVTATTVAVVAVALSGTVFAGVAGGVVRHPVPALLAVAGLLAAVVLARVARRGAALLTGLAAALPVLAVGLALYPYAMPSSVDASAGLTVADAAAGTDALRLLTWLTAPLLPVLVGFQLLCWWLFRIRPDRPAPVHW